MIIRNHVIVWLIVYMVTVTTTACSVHMSEQQPQSPQASVPHPHSQIVNIEPSPFQQATSPIRKVDFTNYSYPASPIYSSKEGLITLNKGSFAGSTAYDPMSLAYVIYGDVTGDGIEEAMVTLQIVVQGSAIPHVTYIYALKDGNPELLWSLLTGDRAGGGIRQVHSQDGDLIVEKFSSVNSNGDCCPSLFTRTRYKWRVSQFERIGKEETLPNPRGNAAPVMERYTHSSEGE